MYGGIGARFTTFFGIKWHLALKQRLKLVHNLCYIANKFNVNERSIACVQYYWIKDENIVKKNWLLLKPIARCIQYS